MPAPCLKLKCQNGPFHKWHRRRRGSGNKWCREKNEDKWNKENGEAIGRVGGGVGGRKRRERVAGRGRGGGGMGKEGYGGIKGEGRGQLAWLCKAKLRILEYLTGSWLKSAIFCWRHFRMPLKRNATISRILKIIWQTIRKLSQVFLSQFNIN